jgi:uncharacterized membrane protein (DUF485 family)
MAMDDITCAQVRANPDFIALERERGRLGWSLAIIMLVIYFGFVCLVAFAPRLLGTPIAGVITLGFPLGLLVILSAIALTGIYVFQANRRVDGMTSRIVEASR